MSSQSNIFKLNIHSNYMKKRGILFAGVFLVILMQFIFVSAQYGPGLSGINLGDGIRQIIDQIINFITPVFQYLIGDYSGSEIFFYKILFLIIIFVMIFAILDRVPLFEGYPGITKVIALSVSLIAIRFISENQLVQGIILPYGAIGVAVTTILPFFIFGYGIYQARLPGIARKIAWMVLGIIFIVLWLYMPELQIGGESGYNNNLINQIYLWTIVAIGSMIVFDKRVAAYFRGLDVKQWENENYQSEVVSLQNQLSDITRAAQAGPLSRDQEERRIKIARRLRKLTGRHDFGLMR